MSSSKKHLKLHLNIEEINLHKIIRDVIFTHGVRNYQQDFSQTKFIKNFSKSNNQFFNIKNRFEILSKESLIQPWSYLPLKKIYVPL